MRHNRHRHRYLCVKILKVRFGCRGRERASSLHHVFPNASNVTASPRCQGLTAGWLFSCFRTTPNSDDMAKGPTGWQRGKFPHCTKKLRERWCSASVWMSFCRGSFFHPLHTGSVREHGEALTTPSAVSQSRDATVTAAHVAPVNVCRFFRQQLVSQTI